MSIFDDILEMKKKAAPVSMGQVGKKGLGFLGNMGKATAIGAGAGIAGAAISGAGIAASKIYDAATKARDFRAMMGSSFNADLHDYYHQKPRQFNEAYSSLRMMNPEFSKDPMVAGNFMRQMMENRPEVAGGVLLQALHARRDVPPSPMLETFQRSGASAAGGAMGEFGRPPKLKSPEEIEQELFLESQKARIKKEVGGRGEEEEQPKAPSTRKPQTTRGWGGPAEP